MRFSLQSFLLSAFVQAGGAFSRLCRPVLRDKVSTKIKRGGLVLLGLVIALGWLPAPLPGQYLYIAENSLSAYSINSSTGVLTPVPGSPFPLAGVAESAVADPTGRFVYVINAGISKCSRLIGRPEYPLRSPALHLLPRTPTTQVTSSFLPGQRL